MYFVIHSSIYHDPDHPKIFQALEDLCIDYEVIDVKPTTTELVLKENRKDVFVYGSVPIARLAKKYTDWFPGSLYGGNHLFEIYSQYYQNNLLNDDVKIYQLGDFFPWEKGEQKFIKPYRDAKIFTGKTFEKEEWEDFVLELLENPKSSLVNKKAFIQIAPVKKIIKEARLWIVGKHIVDAGYYKFHGDITFENKIPAEALDFAKKMIEKFEIAKAFVMDICLTNEGWKIVEINCINSSGFYPNTDVKSVIKALNVYFSN